MSKIQIGYGKNLSIDTAPLIFSKLVCQLNKIPSPVESFLGWLGHVRYDLISVIFPPCSDKANARVLNKGLSTVIPLY